MKKHPTADNPQQQGFTRYVEKEAFDHLCEKVDLTFYGSEGRNGIIGDVRDIKTQLNIMKWVVGLSVSIISPVITALILKFLFKI